MSEELKRTAALRALDEVRDGMNIGLGTGSTANHFIAALGDRVRAGLRVTGLPTSEQSARLARDAGIPLATFDEIDRLELTVDGADEISPELDLIKGLGGALFREKVVARSSSRLVIVADDSKLVTRLGMRTAVPVEVVPFATLPVSRLLARRGGAATLRMKSGVPFVTDNQNFILDWACGAIDDPAIMDSWLKSQTGVVESGIFASMADTAYVATPAGVRVLRRNG